MSEDDAERLLRGVTDTDSPEVARLLAALRAKFDSPDLPQVGAALSEFVDPTVTTAPAARSFAPPLDRPAREAGIDERRTEHSGAPRRVLSGIGAFAGTFVGKLILGSAVALALAGGGHAIGLFHLPVIDERAPAPAPAPAPTPVPQHVEVPPTVSVEHTPATDPGHTDVASSPAKATPTTSLEASPGAVEPDDADTPADPVASTVAEPTAATTTTPDSSG